MSIPLYVQGADLPDYGAEWYDPDGDLIDFSSGWTFEAKVGTPGSAAEFTTTDVTGAATAPNATVTFATTGELNDLDPGIYTVQIKATRTADGKERFFTGLLRVVAAIT